MRRILFSILLLLIALPCFAEELYVGQSTAGEDSGSSCANQKAASWFNTAGSWGVGAGKISAGDTVHLCGTITTLLAVKGSGSAGSVITIKFEDNAKLSNTGSSNILYGLLDITGVSYITVDGGTNGIIEVTDNGDNLTYQNICYGLNIVNASNIEAKNLTIRNMYVAVEDHGDARAGGSATWTITIGNSTYVLIHHNTIHDAERGVFHQSGGTSSNISIYSNTIYNCNWGIGLTSAGAGVTLTDTLVYNNDITIGSNWDDVANNYHHNGLFAYTDDSGNIGHIANLSFYNNYVHGRATGGWLSTASFFTEGWVTGIKVYNNLFDMSTGGTTGISLWPFEVAQAAAIYNNTFIGNTKTTYSYKAYGAVATSAVLISGSTNSVITEKNNIIHTFTYGTLTGSGAATIVADYNDIYNAANYGSIGGTAYTAWSGAGSWQTAGYDANGINTDPGLDGSYKPGASSNVKWVGTATGQLSNTDKPGISWHSPPSIGAYEFSAYNGIAIGSGGTMTLGAGGTITLAP